MFSYRTIFPRITQINRETFFANRAVISPTSKFQKSALLYTLRIERAFPTSKPPN